MILAPETKRDADMILAPETKTQRFNIFMYMRFGI
jgi:hypothetical protein